MLIDTKVLKLFARPMVFFLSVSVITGCAAMDPLTLVGAPKRDHEQNICIIQSNYRLQKKYDLLEESLLEQYEKCSNNELHLGKLYASLDLAEFYIYGLINYQKALDFYGKADDLNKLCRKENITSNGTGIVYYKGEGCYTLPRKYDFNEISNSISHGREHIAGLLGDFSGELSHVQVANRRAVFPRITTVNTSQYAHAVHVSGNLLDPSMFNSFEQNLLRKTKAYFQLRHKLSENDKTYYVHFNVAKCLIKSSDFSALSISQVNSILNHISEASANKPTNETTTQDAYLNFGRVLCFNRMGRHAEAIRCFAEFQRDVRQVQAIVTEYMNHLKKAKQNAIMTGTAKTAAFLMLDILTISLSLACGVPFYTRLTAAGVLDLATNIPDLQRQILFLGESEYSKEINLILNMDDQLQLFRAVGDSYHRMGNLSESIRYNKEAIYIISNLRSTISSERGRIGFAKFKTEIYNNLIDALIADNCPGDAFFYSENARARALVDLLGSKKGILYKNKKVNNYVREARKSQIHRDAMLKGTSISDEQANYINKMQTPFLTERGMVVEELPNRKMNCNIEDRQEVLSLVTVSNLNVSQIQAMLPHDVTLVEYYVSDNDVYAWVLSNKTFRFHALETSPEKLKESLRRFNILIQYPKPGRSLKQIKLAGQALYNILFSRLKQHVKTKQILIVGHRFLHFMPFEVLYDGQQFLVERYSFSYLPSSSVLQFLKPEDDVLDSCLALGNPDIDYIENITSLKGAEKETTSIGKVFAIRKVYLHRNATETVLRREARNYKALHVACHGVFDSTDPLNSRVLLARDNENDGIVTAREIYGMQLNALLVTLSACESGMASVENGDELVGLVRAFFFSGASSLLATLWKVDDMATLQIMYRFYRYLISDRKYTAKAIQLAKIDMIKSKQYNHPVFWAPFRLYGLGR